MKQTITWLAAGLRLAALIGFVAALGARAHEPFDLSSRITIYDDRLELVSTLGREAMQQLLSAAGDSPEQIEESLKSLGPDAPVKHATVVATLFFELKSAGAPLSPRQISSVSEGAEIILTLTFSRPAEGRLEARAACYETIPSLSHGVLAIFDDNAGHLDAALLSRERPRLIVTVPARSDAKKAAPPAPESGGAQQKVRPKRVSAGLHHRMR